MSHALVIGGGLSGATLSLHLQKAGCQVILIEREAGPHHKMCGEFLSREALSFLRAVQVDPVALGSATIHSVRLVTRHVVAESHLGFRAESLSRKRLDEALLKCARESGVEVIRGQRVERLERVGEQWCAQLSNATTRTAPQAFLATGKHDLRHRARPAGRHNDLVAFKMYWRLNKRQCKELSGNVELTLFPGGYCGLQLVEDSLANLCLLIERSALRRLEGKWANVLECVQSASPHTANRLAGAEAQWATPLALSAIPYGYVCKDADGPWRLGDQAAVIPSFAGNGMSIALASARVAAGMFLRGNTASEYYRHLNSLVARPVALATVLSKTLVYAHALRPIELTARFFPSLLRHIAKATRLSSETAEHFGTHPPKRLFFAGPRSGN